MVCGCAFQLTVLRCGACFAGTDGARAAAQLQQTSWQHLQLEGATDCQKCVAWGPATSQSA